MEYTTNAPPRAVLYTPDEPKPRKDMFPRVLSFIAVALSAAAVALTLLHAGPQGLRGVPGPSGAQGQTGATGPAAYDPYGYICTTTNVPFNGVLKTAFSPCSDVNPNNP